MTFLVHCTVANIGDRMGSTVVKMYIQDVLASRIRPLRLLRAFRKLELQRGKSCEVVLSVGIVIWGSIWRTANLLLSRESLLVYW